MITEKMIKESEKIIDHFNLHTPKALINVIAIYEAGVVAQYDLIGGSLHGPYGMKKEIVETFALLHSNNSNRVFPKFNYKLTDKILMVESGSERTKIAWLRQHKSEKLPIKFGKKKFSLITDLYSIFIIDDTGKMNHYSCTGIIKKRSINEIFLLDSFLPNVHYSNEVCVGTCTWEISDDIEMWINRAETAFWNGNFNTWHISNEKVKKKLENSKPIVISDLLKNSKRLTDEFEKF